MGMLIFGMLVVIAAIVVATIRFEGRRVHPSISGGIAVVGVAVAVCSGFTVIEAGNRGVVTVFGQAEPVALDPGLHLVRPWAVVTEMNAQLQKLDDTQEAETSDTQTVTITTYLNWKPVDSDLPVMYRDLGIGYADKIITPAIRECVKAEVAKHKVVDLVANRPVIRSAIEDKLGVWLARHSITLVEFSLADIDFSATYDASIESKQSAEQDTLKKLYEVKSAEADAAKARAHAQGLADSAAIAADGESRSRVTAAKGQAESLRIRGEAQAEYNRKVAASLTPEMIELIRSEKWDGKLPVYAQTVLPFLRAGSP